MDKKKQGKLEELLKSKSVTGAILAMAIPTVASQLISVIYNYADSIYVGLMNNPEQVAAIALALPLTIAMIALGNFWGIGGGSAYARALGSHAPERAAKVFAFSIYATVFSSALLSCLALLCEERFAKLLGATEGVLPYAISYFFWFFVLGCLPTVLSLVLAHFVRAAGYAKLASAGLTIGCVLNIILDPIFIFPFGFNLGVAGAAEATTISNTIATLILGIGLFRLRKQTPLSLSISTLLPGWKLANEVMSVGLPSALLMLLSAISNCVLNSLVARHGAQAVAAIGIAKKLDTLPTHISSGITQGALPLMAYAYAAGLKDKLKNILYMTLKLGLAILILIVLILEILASPMSRMFIQDPLTVQYATSFIRILCLSIPLLTISTTVNTCFQATNNPKIAFVLSIIRKGMLDIPLMLLFESMFFFTNIIWVQPIMDVIAASISLMVVRRYFREKA